MAKIVHVIIACGYRDGFGYQENILPAKHRQLGYDVSIITQDDRNNVTSFQKYVNRDGVNVYVLPRVKKKWQIKMRIAMFLKDTKGLYKTLTEINPDIIFVHGLQANDNKEVIKYVEKNPNVKLFVDQHGDYYNMPFNTPLEFICQKFIYKSIAQKFSRLAEVMWGVTPWRVKYLQDVYKVKPEKTDLLVMGGDENLIPWDERESIRRDLRSRYGIPQEAFLIVHGGKINKQKNTHLLINAIHKLNRNDIYLLLFGNYDNDMRAIVDKEQSPFIINIGWIDSTRVYPLFLASDLGCFPGTHSVLWEQACASGLPCVFKDWDGGMSHVDVGGNCVLLKDITTDKLVDTIGSLLDNSPLYKQMKSVSETKARKYFSYINIAKRSIGLE